MFTQKQLFPINRKTNRFKEKSQPLEEVKKVIEPVEPADQIEQGEEPGE